MEVKTEAGGTFEAAGNGTKALGIIGTVLGGLGLAGMGGINFLNNGAGNGFNGCNGNWGNHWNNGPHERLVTREAFDWAQMYDNAQMNLQKEKAERYTDKAVIEGRENQRQVIKDVTDAVIQTGLAVAKLNEQVICLNEKQKLKEEIQELKLEAAKKELFGAIAVESERRKNGDDSLCGAIALEAERRCNGDGNIYSYVNATFVPGKLIMPATRVCPEPMPRYNSFTAPTDAAAPVTPAVTA